MVEPELSNMDGGSPKHHSLKVVTQAEQAVEEMTTR
jgi:hypothetical protein